MIVATCNNCGDEHRLGERPFTGGMATECPECQSVSYSSESNGERVTASEEDRIINVVMPISGVGDETTINIIEYFDLYAEMENASIEELCSIDGVGKKVAKRIQRQS